MADLSNLANVLIEARAHKAAVEESLKLANKAVEAAEQELFAAMVDSEIPSFDANGFKFSLDLKAYYSVDKARLDEFHEVMAALGRGDIFKFTVHYQTLQATLRELVGEKGEMPAEVAEFVSVFDQGKVSVRKASTSR